MQLSYLVMFVYISFTLGDRAPGVAPFYVTSKVRESALFGKASTSCLRHAPCKFLQSGGREAWGKRTARKAFREKALDYIASSTKLYCSEL